MIPGILQKDFNGTDEAPYLTSAHIGIWTYKSGGGPTRWISFPSAYLYPFPACMPAFWLYRFVRKPKRPVVTLCPTCRYDLRAHTPGQSCPECGTPISIAPPSRKQLHSTP
jgi:hypothetical protein